MAKQTPTLYSISKTFVWFAITSILLTGCLIATILLDHNREWKNWQKKFNQLKLQKAQTELKEVSSKIAPKQVDALNQDLEKAKQNFLTHKKEFESNTKEASKLDIAIIKLKKEYQSVKQHEDSYKYYAEEKMLHKETSAGAYKAKLYNAASKSEELKKQLSNLEKQKEILDQKITSLQKAQDSAQKNIDVYMSEKIQAQKRVDKLKPSVVKEILNAPMLDFISPTLQVQQIVLEDLYDDYHFSKVQKVDRCTTCHLGIDQRGYENAPQPFKTHPNLDLYLGSSSKHPIDKFGCTSCHGGSGQALSFNETAHTPKNEHQMKEWKKKYDWHEFHHWENKMLPIQHVQASCVKCHNSQVEIPAADKLNKGKKLAENLGCFNCHKIKGYDNYWMVGPDLKNINNKLSEEWISKWLDNPKEFRASTRMPSIFHLSNNSSPDDRLRNEAAIHAISAYLIKNSTNQVINKAPTSGNIESGEKLVKSLGCLGCHSAAGIDAGRFAPELSSMGSKVSQEWLFAWLKNPKHLSPNTRMPNLRLSDTEAADITAYLLSLKNDSFDKKIPPKAKMEVVDQMILEQLQGTMRSSEAMTELKKMSGDEKLQFLGKKSIAHQGCYACHSIKGFEDAKPIGADLSDEGRKDIHKFDFGFTDIERTRHDWISQKLKNPRIFDQGKIKNYYEKLRMPLFDLTEDEIDSLTTFVLSLSEEQIPLQMRKSLNLNEQSIEKGRLLVSKLNCQGCHTLDGKTSRLKEFTEDPGSAPPSLDGEGAKVQEKWLHKFLSEPTPIRPWLSYRMPTFGLSDEELNTLVMYFHHLAGQQVSFSDKIYDEIHHSSYISAGKNMFETLQCAKCHKITQDSAALGTSFLAPDLSLTKHRLKPDWVHKWLEDPQVLQEGTMMPTFFADGQSPITDVLEGDAQKQIKAIRDYLYSYEASEEPSTGLKNNTI